MAATSNNTAAAHYLDFQAVGWSQPMKGIYDESYRWMDEWLDGRRDVVLDGDRRPGGGPAGRPYQQSVQEIIHRSALLRSELLAEDANLCCSNCRLTKP